MKDVKFRTITVSQKGQIAIPSDIRKEVGIKKGDELLLIQKDEKILIEKPMKVIKRFRKSGQQIVGE
jgi:AbrB family looped-hinge helix DNA binding protein